MNDSFSRTTSGRIVIISAGVVLLTVSLMSYANLEMWSAIPALVPMFAGVAAIFAVGIAIAEDRLGIAFALILGYPLLGMLMVLAYFSAASLSGAAAAVFAVIGIVGIAKGSMPVASDALREGSVTA